MAVFAFSWQAVLLLVGAVFFLGLLTFLFDFCNPRRIQKENRGLKTEEEGDRDCWTRFFRRSMDVGALLIQQGPAQNEYHTTAFYIIFGVWGLSCVVLVGVYNSFILLTALAQRRELPFKDLRYDLDMPLRALLI